MGRKLTPEDYSKHLQHNLAALVDNGRIGCSKIQPTDIQTKPNKYIEITKGFRNYHFCIDIPYAGKILNWEIIFDPEDLSQLPDFDFNDNSFLPEPDINYIAENVPSWDSWDLTNRMSILNILNEFLALYKKTQVEKLFKQNKYEQIKIQYEDLIQSMNLSLDKVEVQIDTKAEYEITNEENATVNFLIVLPIDYKLLPEYVQADEDEMLNPGEDFAHLCIQAKNIISKISLIMSPKVEQQMGKLKLPKIRKDATLAEYAHCVKDVIENQIDGIVQQFRARKLFVMSVVDAFSSGIVEYDSNKFFKVSFLYEDIEDYSCLVTILLGGKFPVDRPKIQLHSLYCQLARNCNTVLSTYGFSVEESAEENMQALREFLKEEVKQFQNHRH